MVVCIGVGRNLPRSNIFIWLIVSLLILSLLIVEKPTEQLMASYCPLVIAKKSI